MSAEKIINAAETFITSKTSEMNEKKISRTVDINHLIARVRSEKQKENKVNLIFLSLFAALISIIIIILSF
jgi:hypothetical protein